MKKVKELILPLYIIFNVIYLLISSINITIGKITYEKYANGFIYFLIINIILSIVLLIIHKLKKKFKFNLIDLFIILIIIFSFISYKYAINKDVALHGMINRYEGLYTILYYISLLYITTFVDKKYKKIIVYSILITGLINALYCICQVLNILKPLEDKGWLTIYRRYYKKEVWASGFISNPNFFGAYMLMCISYSLGLYVDSKKVISKIIYSILIIIFMINILMCNTLSCLVGLLVVLLYLIVYCIKNKKVLSLIILILLLLNTTVFIAFSGHTTLLKDFITSSKEVKEIAKGNSSDDYGTHRIFIWKKTLKIVPENIVYGVGIDNFYYAFGNTPLYQGRFVYDKAHNEYLQILICEGIFALLSYLALYGIIIIKGIKNSFKNKHTYLILPVIGYLVQAFFGISVIEVAPLFFISLGLLYDRKKEI